MEQIINPQILFIAEVLIFLSVISMHLTKKRIPIIYFYMIQSFVISLLLVYSAFKGSSIPLITVAVVIFAVKVIVAPMYFLHLIKRYKLQFSAGSYLNLSATLLVLAIITAMTNSRVFQPLLTLAPANEKALLSSFAAMFISLFLIINRKGAFSQIMGVLSLENSVFAFVFAAGLGQGPWLELSLVFDIFLWIIVASVFVSMIYKKFDTLDVTVMTHLKG